MDAIYHMCRAFDGEVTHVEGDVDPVRWVFGALQWLRGPAATPWTAC